MARTYSHRLTPRTTLGVGISAPGVYHWHDAPRDYDDFTRMYSRWLDGPVYPSAFASDEERTREHTLNWRVFGSAEPTLADLERVGWQPAQHPGPLGLWQVRSLDMTGIPAEIAEDGALLNGLLYAARDAARRRTRDFADVRLPAGLDPRRWPKLLDALRPDAMRERTRSEIWARNCITDTGATAMLKNTWNNAGSAVAIFDHLVIAYGNQGYALLTTAITNGATGVVSLACAGGIQVAAVRAETYSATAGGGVIVSYGTANAEGYSPTGTNAQGATAIAVTSQTAAAAHAINDYITENPKVADNPSSVSNSTDSGALSSGAFSFSGAGAGNRQVAIAFTFPTSSPAGAYTDAYTSNAGTIAAGTTASHLIVPPQTINSTTSLSFTATEKC